MKFNKIAIIGVGLIGGSIGLAAKKKKLAREIIGVCRHKASLQSARKIGAVDGWTLDYREAVKDAELIILAAPISQIIKTGKKVLPYVKEGCLLTDVGSTKEVIVREIEKDLPPNVCFVGAHPLAGSEKKGASYAQADLFKNALCLLTKTNKTEPQALDKIRQFWQILGCRVKVVTPLRHDKIVALVSHLPHLVAVELVNVADKSLDFAASGFRDTTRIASSESEIWTDIFLTNIKYTLKALDAYIRRLKLMRRLIANKSGSKLNSEFKRAKTLRDALQK